MRRRNRRRDPVGDAIAEGRAVPAGSLHDPDDVDALRTAITLKAAQPAADLPSEEFVASLRQQLADEGAPRSRRQLSRRTVLGTAGAAAAGVAVGAAGIALDRTFLAPDSGSPRRAAELDPVDGQWLGVASEAELAAGAPHRFATATLVGFVTATGDDLVAVSAACTHLGCILQQNDTAGRFDCPCHRTAFGYDGRLLFSQLPATPAPLTRLQVRRREGSVEVLVPPPV
jgi:Rieske Fe-S protein